jgi:hypothetical protein
MNEKIKNLLGEELSKQVMEKLGDVQIGVTNDGTLVPAEKHEQLKADHKELNTKLEEANNNLKELSNTSSTVEELKAKLEESNLNYEQYKKEVESRESNRAKQQRLESLLKENGALDSAVDLLVGTFNLDEIQFDKKDNIVDSESIIEDLKTKRKALFETKTVDSEKSKKGESNNTDELDDQAYFNMRMKEQ